MDFSEYTLISFGDSYTYGDGLSPHVHSTNLYRVWQKWVNDDKQQASKAITKAYEQNASQSRKKSYTALLSSILGFKDYINFGVPGGSNGTSIRLLKNYMRQNPNKKVFVIINLTEAQRTEYIPAKHQDKKHKTITSASVRQIEQDTNSHTTEAIFTNLLTHWTLIYNHIQILYDIEDVVTLYNIPYVIFDIVNTLDHNLEREYKILKNEVDINYGTYFSTNMKHFFPNNDFTIDIVKEYVTRISNNTTLKHYLDYAWLRENEKQNEHKYCPIINFSTLIRSNFYNTHDKKFGNDADKLDELEKQQLISNIDHAHWSPLGHSMCADYLANYIKREYSNE